METTHPRIVIQKWIICYPYWWATQWKRLVNADSCVVLTFSYN